MFWRSRAKKCGLWPAMNCPLKDVHHPKSGQRNGATCKNKNIHRVDDQGSTRRPKQKFVAVLARTCTSLGRAIEYFAAVLPSATNVPLPVARSDGLGWNPAVFVGDGPKRIRFLLVKSINKCAVSHASQSFPLVTERSTLAPDLAFARSSIIEAVQLAAIGPLVNLMQMFANFLLI